jgi:hypothetical protein
MSLTEAKEFTTATVGEFGHINVRIDAVVYREENETKVEVSRVPHRHVIAPGADLSKEHPRVQSIAKGAWTSEVVTKYKALKAAAKTEG